MAHSFANGQTKPQRTRIQQGAVSLLSGLKKSAGGYLVEVMPFPYTVEPKDADSIAQFVAMLSRAPSVAIAVGARESEIKTIGGFYEGGEIDLMVYVSSNNARNAQIGRLEIDTAGLAADTADPGLHIVMDHVKELLLGQRLDSGTDIKQVKPHREYEIATLQQITIWCQVYKVTVLVQLDEFRTVQQLLTSLRFRAATNPAEVHLPAAKTDHNTVDVNVDDLA